MSNNKKFIEEYIHSLSGEYKTEELLDKYISDPELKELIRFFENAFPKYELSIDDLLEEGNKVCLRSTIRGVHKGELIGIPATGKEILTSLIVIYEIEDNKISNHWMVADNFGLMQQLGVVK